LPGAPNQFALLCLGRQISLPYFALFLPWAPKTGPEGTIIETYIYYKTQSISLLFINDELKIK